MFPKAKNLRCFWNKLLMNLCICIWINGGWDSWTAISWRQHPVEWIFNYYTRLAEGSHERSLLGVLYGLVGSARNNPSFLTLTSVASTATWATGGTFGSDHVRWDFPRYEVNLVSDFFFHVSSGLRAYICIFKYIYIYVYIIAYPVHAFCNLPQLVLIGNSFNFGFMNPCQVGFILLGPNWGVRNGNDACLISSAAACQHFEGW